LNFPLFAKIASGGACIPDEASSTFRELNRWAFGFVGSAFFVPFFTAQLGFPA
jgi:hypothetical protein